MGLKDKRLVYKPFEYEWCFQEWLKHEQSHWLHTEINMQKDIKDWKEVLTDFEKDLVGKILKGFAVTETFVGDYWSQFVSRVFPKYEVIHMASSFSNREAIHAIAYNYLNETLDLNDFDSFMEDEATMKKLEVLMNADTSDSNENIARSLALFSACTEGIQLFSSFAILMSFRLSNKLTGISQQMIYSVKDENHHSTCGTRLFRDFISEYPDTFTQELKDDIYEGIDLAIQNEFFFIDSAFGDKSLDNLNKNQLKNYMFHRANTKLKELTLEPLYCVDQELLSQMNWFEVMTSGTQATDFFNNTETNYSKVNNDWDDDIF